MSKAATILKRTVQICAVGLATVYFVSGLVYLCLAYWSVTEQDYWRIYEICLNHSWLQSALLKFNGHSLFFPAFIWLADLRFFHGNQAMLFFVSLVLLLVSTSILLLPVWRDSSADLTAKLLATLTLIVGSFWLGRAPITASGGFSCMASFVMLGAALAFVLLPKMRAGSEEFWRATALVICAGVLASFSFGTGLAVWPSLLLLGWSLRLPWRSLGLIATGAISTALIYHYLPPREPSFLVFSGTSDSPGLISLVAFKHLCRLVGGPLFYSVMAWQGTRATTEVIQSSAWLFCGGAAGLVLAAMVVIPRLVRRDLEGSSSEFIGLALISFNLFALVLILAGRVPHFRKYPFEVAAPRYLFWSSLFWAGLLMVAIYYAARRRRLRWPCFLVVFATPILAWPQHRNEGLHWRYSRLLAEESATGLINGVIDPQRLLFPNPKQIELLAPELRAQRLDMFAEGLQDWIGQPVSQLAGGRRDRDDFRGRASVQSLVGGENQANAVKVTGQIFPEKKRPPARMVIVDPQGMVAGIARSFATNDFLNRLLYKGVLPNAPIAGYIRNYNPAFQYVIRAAGGGGVSDQQIAIAALAR